MTFKDCAEAYIKAHGGGCCRKPIPGGEPCRLEFMAFFGAKRVQIEVWSEAVPADDFRPKIFLKGVPESLRRRHQLADAIPLPVPVGDLAEQVPGLFGTQKSERASQITPRVFAPDLWHGDWCSASASANPDGR